MFDLTAVRRASSGPPDRSLKQRYEDLVAKENLQRDANQLRVLEHLEELRMNLCDYHPTEHSLLQRVRKKESVCVVLQCSHCSCSEVLVDLSQRRGSKVSTFMDQLVSPPSTISPLTSVSSSLVLSPGSGKTMLMDMFYSAVNMRRKQRIHFNEFMLNTHNSK